MRIWDFWFDEGVLRLLGCLKTVFWWRLQKVFGIRGGLVTLSKNFVQGLEAMVVGDDEPDFLFWFRFFFLWRRGGGRGWIGLLLFGW